MNKKCTILYIHIGCLSFDIFTTLREMGHEVDGLEYDFDSTEQKYDRRCEHLVSKLKTRHYDFVISYQFIKIVSTICMECGVIYASWIYDSPLMSLFSEEAYHPINYFFIFDKSQTKRMQQLGLKNVYHMPLAINPSRLSAITISDEDINKYKSDISFVGRLYENSVYDKIINKVPKHLKAELNERVMSHVCDWHQKNIWPMASKELTDFWSVDNKYYKEVCGKLDHQLYVGNLFVRKKAEVDRINVLNALASRYKVDLYTSSKSAYLDESIQIHPEISYDTTMNKVYYSSRINLNITMPSIETGVCQRIFDIMGVGGFALSNYQEELDDFFEIGKDLEIFHDLDELMDKVDYYLHHERERLIISINGYKKVTSEHNIKKRLEKMLTIIQG